MNIRNTLARRAAMCVLFPILMVLAPALGLLRGVIEVLNLWERLVRFCGPVWRGDAAESPHAEVGVIGGKLRIHIPIDLLAYAAEHGPAAQGHVPQDANVAGKFRVTDQVAFAKSVSRAMRDSTDEDGGTLLHDMVDDAIERVIENADEGFVWPAIGVVAYDAPIDFNGPLE